MSNPFVSIIIPTHNRAALLPVTLASVFSEEYPAKEVIVVDDGSTDGTAEICARYPVLYLPTEHLGVCAARNFGVARCRGELLVFLDSDDLLPEGTLGLRVESWQREPHIAHLHGRVRRFREEIPGCIDFLDTEEQAYHYLSLGAGILTRDAFEKTGGFDETLRMAEDVDLWLRMREAGHLQKPVPEILLLHRRHPGNTVRDPHVADHAFLNVLHRTIRRKKESRHP